MARACIAANPKVRVINVTGNTSDFVCPAWLNDALQAVISRNETFQSLRDELTRIAIAQQAVYFAKPAE